MKNINNVSIRRYPVAAQLPYAPVEPDVHKQAGADTPGHLDSLDSLPEFSSASPESFINSSGNQATLATVAKRTAATTAPIPIELGATDVPNREVFEQLARRDDVPGALGVREMKFLMTDLDAEEPLIYFMNTNNVQYHYHFATFVLGLELSNPEFNQQTYFIDNRKFLAGTLIAHDSFIASDGQQGVYALEFWPTDPVKVRLVNVAYKAIKQAMPFAKQKIAYHPAGETHRDLYIAEKQQFEQQGIQHISTEQLFGNIAYSPLNLGEGYGRLRLVDAADAKPPSIGDVVIFKLLPNDLSHVAGVLTEQAQTPLSHINLKAKQNNTPNAYVKGASDDPRIKPLIGKLVYLKVAADDIEIREATQEEVDTHLESTRPVETQWPRRDLSRRDIVSLKNIGNADLQAYGAKAANVAELASILTTSNMVPDGYAVPFYFYDQFMQENGLYDVAQNMVNDLTFKQDPAVREKKLSKFRKRIKKTDMNETMLQALQNMHNAYPIEQPLRCRSSTNNEDLEGFNGAGLYDSYTHRPDEGHIQKSIKQVWASLWNYRAFEERDFYRIDHFTTAMAVLVHPNFDDELANGVGLTKNIFDPAWPGNYINVQVGEALVTNPEGGAVPDELIVVRTLVSDVPPVYGNEVIYIRRSNLVTPPDHVMTDDQIEFLSTQMRIIQEHFKRVYRRKDDPTFAMDIEFKIDKHKQLVIKQARPWVD
ncbi:MAG: PEP/pyruvate-binding domain-containing protein [Arenicella sp.]